ncbi:hypothetical protein AB0K34_02650 [Actinomadura sp. NPDC049382]|uniref:hypothetical protein n=1 Tax=Actinomadura sp. NPDC049382 TaxID=3158220 RepID=UPI003436E50B
MPSATAPSTRTPTWTEFLDRCSALVQDEDATLPATVGSLENTRRREVAAYRDLEASGRFGMTRVEDDG